MMGRTHALSGAALFTAGAIPLDLPPDQILVGAVACAGAAVLPDIDHHGSHIARCFGPITRAFAWFVGKVAGGHRNGTHSALGVGLVAALVFFSCAVYTQDEATLWTGLAITGVMLLFGLFFGLLPSKGKGRAAYRKPWHGFLAIMACALAAAGVGTAAYQFGQNAGLVLVGAVVVLILAAAIRPLNIDGIWDDLAPIPITIALLWFEVDLTVLPYAIVVGVVIHIFGDMITRGGCPLGWPWSQTMFGPKWFRTGDRTEKRLVFPALVLILAVSAGVHAGPYLIDRSDQLRQSVDSGT
ncbi:metal-dependent hydrolase [Actinocorallia sp. A-T 12471]|uniref:metal-dependent hydrolase n=1 Tax=Actinocorallia sp. A-T 12471 TaxID=3089813 RepID=UPI0029D310AC|nr:metal-dependent hydrolase [Actinocorallia sp. A-T 12471]MDX6739172.1 metal-dependent hydrolase [Actinocorallia sp. A-T 12471]